MRRIVVDDYLREKLLGFRQPIELCDESGRVLGRFIPVEPQLSEEELQRRENEENYPTPDVPLI